MQSTTIPARPTSAIEPIAAWFRRTVPSAGLQGRLGVAAFLMVMGTCGAAPAHPSAQASEVELRALRVDEAPVLDGVLDEELWQSAPVFDDFIQQVPDNGAPPSERTEVLIVYTEDALYFGMRAFQTGTGGVIANELRYDQPQMHRQDDHMAIILDTFHDHRNGYLFIFNALGTRSDWACTEEGRHWNRYWDPAWEVATDIRSDGWFAEVEIPFKSIRYPAAGGRWGINVRRAVQSRNEWVYATLVSASFPHPSQGIGQLSAAGVLDGLEGITRGRDLEIEPYAAVAPRAEIAGIEADGDTFDAGLDAKYGISSNLTLDLTLNTDFSQVEVDEQQINLTRFGLFFPEKRTFFQEGQGIFDFGVGTGGYRVLPFFSRRIGLEGGQPVPILGGGRLTGKVGNYSVGALAMRTRESGADPASTFSVLRLKRDLLGRSSVGLLLTDQRSGEAAPQNSVAGADANFAFFERGRLELFWVRSTPREPDEPGQPDQPDSTDPPQESSSSAHRARLLLENDLLGFETEWLRVGDVFDPRVGFVQRRDMDRSYVKAQVSPRPGRFGMRKVYFRSSLDYVENLAGFVENRDWKGEIEVEFDRLDTLTFAWQHSTEGLEEPFSIAGVLPVPAGSFDFDYWTLELVTSGSRDLSARVRARGGDFFDGTRRDVGVSGMIKAGRHLWVDVDWTASDIELSTGQLETNLFGVRTSVAFTPDAWSSALLQYNDLTREFGVNARLRYTYRPGSDIYVVFNERLANPLEDPPEVALSIIPSQAVADNNDEWLLRERSLIIKWTYLFRL